LFKGRRYLRMVFMNPQTSLDDVKALIAMLRQPL
jgi:ABC-type glutathione transport system ATPase component